MEDPLLPLPPTATTSNASPSVLTRLAFLLFVTVAALFANHEASKSFEIVIADSVINDSLAAHRFRLSFISNGRATRIVLDSTNHINKVLQLHLHPKKPLRQVTLQLATHNLTRPVMVTHGSGPDDYILSLSPSLLLEKDVGRRVEMAIRLGMARVSVWDGEGTTPIELVNAMSEVLSGLGSGLNPAGPESPCWADPGFLIYCEEERGGFLARLNRGMRVKWQPDTVAEEICGAYRSKSVMGLDQVM